MAAAKFAEGRKRWSLGFENGGKSQQKYQLKVLILFASFQLKASSQVLADCYS